MNPACVVVDANIAFRVVCSGRPDIRSRLDPKNPTKFCCPRFLFVELFKHKERLLRATRLSEDELLAALHALVSRVEFINEADIPIGTWMEAFRLCKDVDELDTPDVALVLHLDGQLWTYDELLKVHLRTRGFDRFFNP